MGVRTLEELFASLEEGFGTKFVPKPSVGTVKIEKSPSKGSLLTDREWRFLSDFLPAPKPRPWRRRDRKGGRPRVSDRACLEAAIWLITKNRPLRALPRKYGARSTIQRRLAEWDKSRVLARMWLNYLEGRPRIAIARTRRRGIWRWTMDGYVGAICRA